MLTTLLILAELGQALGIFVTGMLVGAQLQIKYSKKTRTRKSKKQK